MSITVRELLDMPHLQLRLHSGKAGLDRQVTWTHTSDLPEPWQWVSSGELLMTNGMSFPADADGQEQLLDELHRIGASGLAIGEQMYCPKLTGRFTQASERLGLPVLWIRYPMPFVAISRAIAEATLLEQSQRLMRTARIYDALRRTTGGDVARSRTADALTKELRCPVFVCDRVTAEAYHPDGPHPPDDVKATVRTASQGTLVAGARSVLTDSGVEVLVGEVPTHDNAVLAVIREGGVALDGVLIQHAATVVALELSQTHLALEHTRRSGAELTAQLMDGSIDRRGGRRQLLSLGLDPAHAVFVSATGADERRLRDLHVALWRRRIPHVTAFRSGVAHAVVPGTDEAVEAIAGSLGPNARVGAGRALQSVARSAESAREATWALGTAQRTDVQLVRYGSATSWLGVGGVDDAQAMVERWLGPLIEHDAQHRTGLVETLEAFLANQRSWQRTAEAMNVHRQTVLYRIHKVEELTGAHLTDTADIAQLWLALQSRDLLGGSK
ncbi:PucR family transcriptional regulator ligand-binding domain-containing protein [Mycolicibacterium mucogenicum]|uniref:PucR family transcriptional regulator n=1 Tax=Mycolicibacterium mucogenicum TaxID=56689 RepID=UPI002269982B|nr:PucR family transcriptional regulator [Mycolicibacterium mucogenicum]MCX8561931.1 PucR family transcriptional regulator ligand-binding domain-containing protein [Mycolicibacterium mucogenicum]